jgi:hypothetical protein
MVNPLGVMLLGMRNLAAGEVKLEGCNSYPHSLGRHHARTLAGGCRLCPPVDASGYSTGADAAFRHSGDSFKALGSERLIMPTPDLLVKPHLHPTEVDQARLYSPSWIDRFTAWLDRLPFPCWLSYLGLWLALLLPYSAVKWWDSAYPLGIFNGFHLLLTGTSVYGLALMHYLDRNAGAALAAFRPVLTVDAQGYAALLYRLTPAHTLGGNPGWSVARSLLFVSPTSVRPFQARHLPVGTRIGNHPLLFHLGGSRCVCLPHPAPITAGQSHLHGLYPHQSLSARPTLCPLPPDGAPRPRHHLPECSLGARGGV